jgi:hypothetical protein
LEICREEMTGTTQIISTVHLSSSNTSVATVPSSVLIPAGSKAVTFTIATGVVSSASAATIKATSANTKSATLTVNPAATVNWTGGPELNGTWCPYRVNVLLQILTAIAKTKLRNYFFDAYGPYPIVGAALAAGINQLDNASPEWKQGAQGYVIQPTAGCSSGAGSVFGSHMRP